MKKTGCLRLGCTCNPLVTHSLLMSLFIVIHTSPSIALSSAWDTWVRSDGSRSIHGPARPAFLPGRGLSEAYEAVQPPERRAALCWRPILVLGPGGPRRGPGVYAQELMGGFTGWLFMEVGSKSDKRLPGLHGIAFCSRHKHWAACGVDLCVRTARVSSAGLHLILRLHAFLSGWAR